MKNQVNRWEPLVPGDVIDIIAPASAATLEKTTAGLSWIKQQGLIPRFSERLIETDVFFAAPLSEQWEQLEKALYSDSKVIWCLRGGYGSMRLIPLLEKIKIPPKPKLLIGFSDITALHIYFNQKWNWPTLHGRTISQLHPEWEMNQEQQQLLDLLFGRTEEVSFTNLIPMNESAKANLVINAPIVGGNLRILQSSLGTAWEVASRDKILFIEDVAERGYSVDRMLEQLHQANVTNLNLKALLIGDFTEGFEKNGKDLVQVALKRFAERVNYPVISGVPCGHAKNSNAALPFNTPSTLTLGASPHLVCRVNH